MRAASKHIVRRILNAGGLALNLSILNNVSKAGQKDIVSMILASKPDLDFNNGHHRQVLEAYNTARKLAAKNEHNETANVIQQYITRVVPSRYLSIYLR